MLVTVWLTLIRSRPSYDEPLPSLAGCGAAGRHVDSGAGDWSSCGAAASPCAGQAAARAAARQPGVLLLAGGGGADTARRGLRIDPVPVGRRILVFSDNSRGILENANELARGYYDENQRAVGDNTIAMASDLRFFLERMPITSPEFAEQYFLQVYSRELSESADPAASA